MQKQELENIPLSQQAYELIKEKIVTLELGPGNVIDEAELQEELQLGRTPIREALKRLALEKLVTIVPRRGIFVTDIGISDLQRLLEVRLALEGLAARLAAQRGKRRHWDEMDALMEPLARASAAGDSDTVIALDEAFHEILYAATDNEFLQDNLSVLFTLNKRLWYFFLTERGEMSGAVAEHRAILDSLKARDGEQASAQIEHHIRAFQEKMQAILLGTVPSDGART